MIRITNKLDEQYCGRSLYIVCNKPKFVWFVVPKTATRTLHQTFADLNGKALPAERLKKFKAPRGNKHFKFTFVRNPYSRIVSTFLDKTKKVIGSRWQITSYVRWSKHSFPEFVKELANSPGQKDRHVLGQVGLANNMQGLDFVGRVENLEEDVHKLTEKLGYNTHKPLPHKNKASRDSKPYWEYYTDETIDLVTRLYKRDIDAFDYKFGE